MAKNKAKVASKSRKSALRVEALEQRQLLAQVSPGGTQFENLSNPLNPGILYDQVLMTGSSVTVSADPGQITRVSFLDKSGDIIQAEFSGQGTMTVSLEDFVAAAAPANYNQPGVNYVQGLASFTIQGSDATTNFSVFSVGSGNAVNQGLFSGGKTGGDHDADVARLLIVADPSNPGGFSTFGGIRAGNAVFAAGTGVVGIAANNVNVQGPVIIGDVDASNSGVPTLNFGAASQFATVSVAGGDLVQTNNAQIVGGTANGIQSINFTAGASSLVAPGGAGDLPAKVTTNANLFTGAEPTLTTLDTISAFDLTGKTQGEIDAAFTGRTFINNVVVSGDLTTANFLNAADFRGKLTFTGTINGAVTVTAGGIGSLEILKTSESNISVANGNVGAVTIGSSTASANFKGTLGAKNIGDVTITGDLDGGKFTTDVVSSNDAWTDGEGTVGKLTVNGSIKGGAQVEGILGIGNITVTKDITASTDGVFVTRSGTAPGAAFTANIGTIMVDGDIDTNDNSKKLILIDENGTFGDITIKGGGSTGKNGESIGNNDWIQVGAVQIDGKLGGSSVKTGKITITEGGNDLRFNGLIVPNAEGTVQAVTITGGAVAKADAAIGTINAANTTFEGITVSGYQSITANGTDLKAKTLSAVSFTTITGDATNATSIAVNTVIGGSDAIGSVTLNAGTTNSTVTVDSTAGGIRSSKGFSGDVAITGATINLNRADSIFADDADAKSFVFNGNTNITAAGAINIDKKATALTFNGKLTVSGGAGSIDVADTLGSLTVSDALTFTSTAAANGTTANSINTKSITGALSLGGLNFGFKDLNANSTNDGTATDAVASGVFNIGGSVGSLVLNGTTDISTNNTTPALTTFTLDNDGSGRDTIGSLTIGGRFISADATTDIRASSVGDVTISGKLTQDQTLVTNLNILAAPNGDATLSKAETVALDGSNLANYVIGNVSVSSSLDLAFTGTKLFGGDNSFISLGGMGNINLTGASSGAQQSALFGTANDSAVFQVGDVDGLFNATAKTDTRTVQVDTNSDGTIDTNDTDLAQTGTGPDFTGGTVSIGNVTVNALQTTTSGGNSGVDAIGGLLTTTSATAHGLEILAGVRSTAGAGDVFATTNAGGGYTALVTDIDANLKGTVGNILIASNNSVGFLDKTATAGNLVGPNANSFHGGIAAATSVGTQQISGASSNTTGVVAIIGDTNATDDDNAVENGDQIVVVIV